MTLSPRMPRLPDKVHFCLVHLKGRLCSSEQSRAWRTEWRSEQCRRSNQELQHRWSDPNPTVAKSRKTQVGPEPLPTGAKQNFQSEPSQAIWVLKKNLSALRRQQHLQSRIYMAERHGAQSPIQN